LHIFVSPTNITSQEHVQRCLVQPSKGQSNNGEVNRNERLQRI